MLLSCQQQHVGAPHFARRQYGTHPVLGVYISHACTMGDTTVVNLAIHCLSSFFSRLFAEVPCQCPPPNLFFLVPPPGPLRNTILTGLERAPHKQQL